MNQTSVSCLGARSTSKRTRLLELAGGTNRLAEDASIAAADASAMASKSEGGTRHKKTATQEGGGGEGTRKRTRGRGQFTPLKTRTRTRDRSGGEEGDHNMQVEVEPWKGRGLPPAGVECTGAVVKAALFPMSVHPRGPNRRHGALWLIVMGG